MKHVVVGVDDVVVAIFFDTGFVGVGFRVGGSEGDVAAVGGKVEGVDAGFDVGDLAGFAAGGGNEIELRGVFFGGGEGGFAGGEEGEPVAVGRPRSEEHTSE